MAISPARAAAFDILLRVEQTQAFASELLHSSQYNVLSAQDHGLATELVMGVLRWQSLLDAEVARFSSQKLEKLDVEVLISLRMAGYQLSRLQRIPARAAVHESVELVRRAGKSSAASFVNAVLRKLSGSVKGGSADAPHQEIGFEALAHHLAHPRWLVKRWSQEFDIRSVEHICSYDQCHPQVAVRGVTPAIEAELLEAGVVLEPGHLVTGSMRVKSGDLVQSRPFREGQVSIQDEGSQLVALLAGKGARILDCCAAPGGKTRLLAERNPQAEIVALELHPHRARRLRKMVPAKNVEVVVGDVLQFAAARKFDLVLADVPCSGTGTLARNPEIKWRLKSADLAILRERQTAILQAALLQVAPGGRLIYSTCSLEPEENSEVVGRLLHIDGSLALIDCSAELQRLQNAGDLAWNDIGSLIRGPYLRTVPGVHPCDGFFAAVFRIQR